MPTSLNFEELDGGRKVDIFQTLDPNEIKMNYEDLLASYGKWNAETYLKAMNILNRGNIFKKNDSQSAKECSGQSFDYRDQKAVDCSSFVRFPKYKSPVERPYQTIFKNARKSKPPREKEPVFISANEDPSFSHVSHLTVKRISDAHKKGSPNVEVVKCKLEQGDNNYLQVLREMKQKAGPNRIISLDRAQAVNELYGDVGLFFHNDIDAALQDDLIEQIEKVGSTLVGSDVGDGIKLPTKGLKEQYHKDTNTAMLEKVFDDPKWQRKFLLRKIEKSEERNSLDVSDVETGQTVFSSDRRPLHKKEKTNAKLVSKPSRIPYIDEVYKRNRKYFNLIAQKWDKIIAKYLHIDESMTPETGRLISDIRLRSTNPQYMELLKEIESFATHDKNAFVPYYYIAHARKSSTMKKDEKVTQLINRRKLIETVELTSVPYQKPKMSLKCSKLAKVKWHNRSILHEILAETKYKADSGDLNWDRKEIAEHYLKLCGIVKTKRRAKLRKEMTKPVDASNYSTFYALTSSETAKPRSRSITILPS